MKKEVFLTLAILIAVLSSCSLFNNEVRNEGIYILDWFAEAVYVIDSTLVSSSMPLLLAGDGPSDIVVNDSNIFIANSGYGGEASIQKFSLDGNLLLEKVTGENTSPGYLEFDDENIYMSLWLDNSVAVMEKESLSLVKTITGIKAPQELVLYENYLYVGSSDISASGSIYKIDLETWALSSIEVGSNPSYIDISDNNEIFVSCVGDYDSIKGKVVKIVEESVVDRVNFNSYLGKVKCFDEYVIVLDAMNAYLLSSDDLSIIDTINMSSPSDVDLMNDKVIFSTHVGKMYVSDKTSVTEVTEFGSEYGFKTIEMFIK